MTAGLGPEADPNQDRPCRKALEAEIARLRAALAESESRRRAIAESAGTDSSPILPAAAEDWTDASQGFLRAVLDSTLDCVKVVEPDGRLSFVNANGLRAMEVEGLDAVRGREWAELLPGPGRARVRAAVAAALDGRASRFEGPAPTVSGAPKWWDVTVAPIPGPDGRPARVVSISRDVTESRRAIRAVRDSDERFRLIVESAAEYAIFTTDREGRVTSWNSGAQRILGWTEAEIVGRDAALLCTEEARAAGEPGIEMRAALARGHVDGEGWMLRRDGARFWAAQTLTRLRDGSGGEGDSRGFLKILRDRTERRLAEAALRESEARFRHMADSAPALIWMTDAEGRITFANMHYDHLFGRPAAEMLGDGWRRFVHPDDADGFAARFARAFAARRKLRTEMRVRDRHDRLRWLRCEGVPRLDDAGAFLGYTVCSVDVTERHEAEALLEGRVAARTAELRDALDRLRAEAREREQAEAALRQAQKMEAVGQLTGGIAHDFNNMLQGIAGSLEMIERRIGQGRTAEASRYIGMARQTADRAAGLTHRLLAFARRQALDPQPVAPDALIAGMEELIRQTVSPRVELELRLGGAGAVLCDSNQLESALLNLAINARDAMPEGGRLSIRTREARLSEAELAGQEGARPGDYVEIAVADTGAGMSPDILARAFEPFFTTKPIGQGTGLGLSQIYGFVRQSGGAVRLDSAPGRGTTVRLCLPRHHGAEAGVAPPATVGGPDAAEGGTVLLVEDEPAVRGLAAEHLRELGCAVLEAADGPAALRLLAGGARADMLVTDVGLPGLNGRQVADAARERRPGLPVLFITGYAGSALDEQGRLPPGMEVINKPFTLDTLARRVRAMIDRAGGQRPG